jgi:hypothetical protein
MNADPAKLDAWLNLSQREKAVALVIVRMSAITADFLCQHVHH